MTQPLDDRVTAAVCDVLHVLQHTGTITVHRANAPVPGLIASAVLAEVHRQTTAAEPPARRTADSITDDELDALYAQLARLRDAAENAAVRLSDGLNPRAATDESPGPENAAQTGTRGSAVLTVVVTAPTQENADQWAATLRDLITAEHGDEMRLDITISPAAAATS